MVLVDSQHCTSSPATTTADFVSEKANVDCAVEKYGFKLREDICGIMKLRSR